ncbi:RNA polymerase II C-terminal domain phosphatase-like 1-like protein [Drosera capensis]
MKGDNGLHQEESKRLPVHENGFLGDPRSLENHLTLENETFTVLATRPEDYILEGSKNSKGSVYALEELCSNEGLGVDFRVQPVVSDSGEMDEVYAEVEVDGQILGKGFGSTSEEAKAQAAEKALASLKPMLGQSTPKRPSSPWSAQDMPTKRLKQDPRMLQRAPSSRYS